MGVRYPAAQTQGGRAAIGTRPTGLDRAAAVRQAAPEEPAAKGRPALDGRIWVGGRPALSAASIDAGSPAGDPSLVQRFFASLSPSFPPSVATGQLAKASPGDAVSQIFPRGDRAGPSPRLL